MGPSRDPWRIEFYSPLQLTQILKHPRQKQTVPETWTRASQPRSGFTPEPSASSSSASYPETKQQCWSGCQRARGRTWSLDDRKGQRQTLVRSEHGSFHHLTSRILWLGIKCRHRIPAQRPAHTGRVGSLRSQRFHSNPTSATQTNINSVGTFPLTPQI